MPDNHESPSVRAAASALGSLEKKLPGGPQNASPAHRNRRSGGNERSGRGKKRKNMGRNEYNRNNRHQLHIDKRLKRDDGSEMVVKTTEDGVKVDHREDGEKEARQPKRKVAVMISYCGSGYKGMQLNPPHKSIEGDLFEAFVKAGAISRANSNDPKKSSLVRCARTDKGVHASGNIISLKLIIEDPNIIPKINQNLPEQIRVWDIIRTTGSFSCYNVCDSRKYEYLVPSYAFLPPHPRSFLTKSCRRYAEKEDDLEGYLSRQKEVESWWGVVDEKVGTILDSKDREEIDRLIEEDSETDDPWKKEIEAKKSTKPGDPTLKQIRAIHQQEKKAFRISPERLERVREALQEYCGTNNFHNFTVDKGFKDPSSKRHIKSFEVNDPIIINGTEWLPMHVHGQSFMMHQIRKMVGLVMMVVRTGCPISRIKEAYGPRKVSIGKAPSLGLLLEYPMFSHYNEKTAKENGRDSLDFSKYKDQIDSFKDKFIYSKIFDVEEQENTFDQFLQYFDSYKSSTYLYLTSAGFKAIDDMPKDAQSQSIKEVPPGEESDEDPAGGDGNDS